MSRGAVRCYTSIAKRCYFNRLTRNSRKTSSTTYVYLFILFAGVLTVLNSIRLSTYDQSNSASHSSSDHFLREKDIEQSTKATNEQITTKPDDINATTTFNTSRYDGDRRFSDAIPVQAIIPLAGEIYNFTCPFPKTSFLEYARCTESEQCEVKATFSETKADLCKRQHTQIFIFKSDSGRNFERRNHARKSFLNSFKTVQIPYAFFVGYESQKERRTLLLEDKAMRDLIIVNQRDEYYALSNKTIAILQWYRNYCGFVRQLIVLDDDVFLFRDNLDLILKAAEGKTNYILGPDLRRSQAPDRNPGHKWSVTHEEYPHCIFPNFFAGGFVAMDIVAVNTILQIHSSYNAFKLDDVYVYGMLREKANSSMILLDAALANNRKHAIYLVQLNRMKSRKERVALVYTSSYVEMDRLGNYASGRISVHASFEVKRGNKKYLNISRHRNGSYTFDYHLAAEDNKAFNDYR